MRTNIKRKGFTFFWQEGNLRILLACHPPDLELVITLALIPRFWEERAWCGQLLNYTNFPEIGIFSVHVCVMTTSLVGVSTCRIRRA